MGANPRRTTKTGARAAARRNRERYKPTHKDKEIQRKLDQHGIDAVNILYDSSY